MQLQGYPKVIEIRLETAKMWRRPPTRCSIRQHFFRGGLCQLVGLRYVNGVRVIACDNIPFDRNRYGYRVCSPMLSHATTYHMTVSAYGATHDRTYYMMLHSPMPAGICRLPRRWGYVAYTPVTPCGICRLESASQSDMYSACHIFAR